MLISFSQLGGAATYYVAANGNDSNPGSLAAPFRTLQKGAYQAVAGDTVIVRDGTYGHVNAVTGGDSSDSAFSPVLLYNSGNASAWITFRAENKHRAILDCELICDSYINLLNASYIAIQDFVITRGYKEAIHSNDAAHHITLRGNRFEYIANRTSSTTLGLDGLYTSGSCHDFIIDGNVFHDIGRSNYNWLDHALYLKGYNYTITNNVFYNNTRGWAIQMANGLSNVLIANNTFAFPGAQDGHIMMWDTQSNITVTNNVFYNPTNYAFSRYTSTVSACTIDHNIVYGASGVMANSSGCTVTANQVGTNPMFVNPSSYDFHMQAGAPGINTGVNLAAVPVDMEGRSRPQGSTTDIGAYEYLSDGVAAAPPAISGVFSSGVTENSAYISWSTSVPATSSVQYGLGSYTSATPISSTLKTQHSVTLSSLTAATLYHYRVASQDSTGQLALSSDFVFTTGPAPTAPPATVVSLSAAAPTISVTAGQQVSSAITAALISGSTVPVTFSRSSLPAGVTATFSSASCSPTCATTLTFATTTSAPGGTYSITVTGAGTGVSASTTIALTIVAPYSAPIDPTSGLAAWWKFNEGLNRKPGSSASDSSGNGNHGTLRGATWSTGSYGSALRFSGSGQYVSVPERASIAMTQQLTVSFWLNAGANPNVDPRVIAKAYSWDVKLNGANRNPQFSAGGNYAMLNYSLPLNTWAHVVFTFSQGVVKGYVNGVPVTFAANTFSSQSLPSYPYGLFIGTDAGLTASYAGMMDEVRLYNRVLSDGEVLAAYSTTLH